MAIQFDYSKKPWELNPNLTEEILNEIAKVIEQKTRECLEERFDTSRGDSHYSYGHTARAWRISGLRSFIESQTFPNLKILKDSGNSFEFAIGQTLMKIYSGSPEDMTPNMKKLSPLEGQLSLKLEGSDNDEIYWRIMISSAPTTHELLNISFTGFNKYGELACVYDAPLEQIPVIYSVDKIGKEAKKLPDAKFSRKKTIKHSEAI